MTPVVLSLLIVAACLWSSVFGATQWDCDFEDGFCEFTTNGQDNAKWVRNTGETETTETGPVSAQEGSYYVYTPAAGNSYDQFYLNLPLSRGFVGFGVNFYYHMYGAYVGYLQVQASTDGGVTYETAWRKDLQQQTAAASAWQFAAFHFEDVINNTAATEINSLRFVGSGTNAQSDIAIDNFVVIPLPSTSPTPVPTQPSQVPTPLPTAQPTHVPTALPTIRPTPAPAQPSPLPSLVPTDSDSPTMPPTALPTPQPTRSDEPTLLPTPRPTAEPSFIPTRIPTLDPTTLPTLNPSLLPTTHPTKSRRPTPSPSWPPSLRPSPSPTTQPTDSPTLTPTSVPSLPPTTEPSPVPSIVPTAQPTHAPTRLPTPRPTPRPTYRPTPVPSLHPTHVPTDSPTPLPTVVPTPPPTSEPTPLPTLSPIWPTPFPTPLPTPKPTAPLAVSSAAVLSAVVAFFALLLCGVVSVRLWRCYKGYSARKHREAVRRLQEKQKATAQAKAEQLQREAEAKRAVIDKLEAEARAEKEAILAAQLRVDVGDVLATATKVWPRSDLEVGSDRGFIDSGHESKEGFSFGDGSFAISSGRGLGGGNAPSPEPPLEAGAKVVVLEVCRGPDTRPLLLRVKRFDDAFATPAPADAAAARRASAKELEAKRRDSSSRSRFRQSFTASKAPPPPNEFWVPALDMAMSHPDDYPPGLAFKTAAQVREVQAAAAEAQTAEAALAKAMAANNGGAEMPGAGTIAGNGSSSRSSNASYSRTRLKRYNAPIASRQGQWPTFEDDNGVDGSSGMQGGAGAGSSGMVSGGLDGGPLNSRTRAAGGGLGSLGGGTSSTRSRARLQRPNIANISRDVKRILQPHAAQAERSQSHSLQPDQTQQDDDEQPNYDQVSSTNIEKDAVMEKTIREVDSEEEESEEDEKDVEDYAGDDQEEDADAAAGVDTLSKREGGSQWRVSEKLTEARLQEWLQPSSSSQLPTQRDDSVDSTAAAPPAAARSAEATTPTLNNQSPPPLPARIKNSPPPPLPSRPIPTSSTGFLQPSPSSTSRPHALVDNETLRPPAPLPPAAVDEPANTDEKEGEAFLFRHGLSHCTSSFQRNGIGDISSLRRLAAEPTDKIMVLLLAKLKMKPADAKTLKNALAAAARDEWPEAHAARFAASRARYNDINVASNPGVTL